MLKGICSKGKSGPQPLSTPSIGQVTPHVHISQGLSNQLAQRHSTSRLFCRGRFPTRFPTPPHGGLQPSTRPRMAPRSSSLPPLLEIKQGVQVSHSRPTWLERSRLLSRPFFSCSRASFLATIASRFLSSSSSSSKARRCSRTLSISMSSHFFCSSIF